MTKTHDIPYKFRFADVPYLNYTQFMMIMIAISFMVIGMVTYLFIYLPVSIIVTRCTLKRNNSVYRNTCLRMWSNLIIYWLLFCFGVLPFVLLSMFSTFPIYASILIAFAITLCVLSHRHIKLNWKERGQIVNSIERAPLIIEEKTHNYYGTVSSLNDDVDRGGNKSGPDSDVSSTQSESGEPESYMKICVDYIRNYPMDMLLGLRRHYIIALFVLLLSAVVPSLLVVPTCSTCFAVRPIVFSSLLSRKIDPKFGIDDKDSVCYRDTICHTYLTVPRDLSTSIIVNFHSFSKKPESAYVGVFVEGSPESIVHYDATFFRMEQIPGQERYQYWVDVTNLQPNTSYIVEGPTVVVAGKILNHKVPRTIKFRTAPSLTSDVEISFVSGGDMEFSEAGKALSRYAAAQKPLFALIGGDIAYENGNPNCFMKVDFWFYNWNNLMVTEDGYTIPILSIIGNHEAGGFRMKRSSVGFYLHYFPHELGLQKINPVNRRLYHEHVFAKHTFIAMTDSYIVTPVVGEQAEWLNQTLSSLNEQQIHRIVAYHGSAYPMVTHEIQDIVSQLRNHFCPLFEEYGVKFVLEHHYHALAQTFPIKNGKVDHENGIHYLGAGAWGLTRKSLGPTPSYLKFQENYSNIYFTRCNSELCEVNTVIYHPKKRETEIYSSLVV